MNLDQAVFISLLVDDPLNWGADWVWGMPLIVLTVVIHVIGLGLINQRVDGATTGAIVRRHPTIAFVLVMGVTTLLATVMHGMEAGIWAAAYRLLHAMRDNKSAMLYSLNAMTSYGHENLALEGHWKLMGAIEALNGWLLFGLTTAFLFGMIEKIRSSLGRGGHHS
jgi:MFS superfamily sulfate permease-like transporter